jgi:hypothetical protein
MTELERAQEALYILREFNNIKNDIDAYLWDIIEWGLGERRERQVPQQYGI